MPDETLVKIGVMISKTTSMMKRGKRNKNIFYTMKLIQLKSRLTTDTREETFLEWFSRAIPFNH